MKTKVVRDDFIQNLSDRGCWFQPVRIRELIQTSYKQFLLRFVVYLNIFNKIDNLSIFIFKKEKKLNIRTFIFLNNFKGEIVVFR